MCAVTMMNHDLVVHLFLAVDGVATVVVEVKEAVHVTAIGKRRTRLRYVIRLFGENRQRQSYQ